MDTVLNNTTKNSGKIISMCLLPNGNVFVVHSYDTFYQLYGMVVTISDTTITQGIDTALKSENMSGYTISAIMLGECVFISHNNGYDYYLNAQIFGIDYENNIPTNNISITEYETQIRKVTTGQFDGIAKTDGVGGDDTGHNDLVSIWTKEGE